MIISNDRAVKPTVEEMEQRPGDLLNMLKFNTLPGPVTARISGGAEYWIETLDVQTGLMRLDVSGRLDRMEFIEANMLIDGDGVEHNPDDFWLEDDQDNTKRKEI